MAPKIVDCFIFYNELQLLLLRLEELYHTVDHFVLVESTVTFAGNEKRLYFEGHKALFHDYMDKIVHVIEDDRLQTKNPWDREKHQRDCIDRGVKQLDLDDDDIITICDLDEIPDVSTLEEIKKTGLEEGKSLHQVLHYYNLMTKRGDWDQAKAVPYRTYLTSTPQRIRMTPYSLLSNGGWHLSYFGTTEFIQDKIRNFSHQEFNNQKVLDAVPDNVANRTDLFNRSNRKYEYVPLNENTYLPKNYKMALFSSFDVLPSS